ncbi:GIY-YIG nuclease family protein [Candidatus Njordibacter sp. Uisw_039]|uniref:GIY-YIG nuclease family protein n=1 Tax=Candidatus Njordibacter sp. Uisw_039 TaxID=3230972 RepID=UPI003D488231
MGNYFYHRNTISPRIYAYEDKTLPGLLKIGYTSINVQTRVKQQYPTTRPGSKPYKIVLDESAMRHDGSSFHDTDVHKILDGVGKREKGEWFRCSKKEILAAISAVKNRTTIELARTQTFTARPEQSAAVKKAAEYYRYQKEEGNNSPHFLWNCKMRFGKTFASYKLAQEMGWSKILILTFKPAVKSAWQTDLLSHVDFEGWKFITKNDINLISLDHDKFVCFGSLQDFLGKNSLGGIKSLNEWVHAAKWDCVIFDEYHFGAWRENSKELFQTSDENKAAVLFESGGPDLDILHNEVPISANAFLYLSGTPFKVLSSGEFIEDQIFNWTYTDEQKAKSEWSVGENPYEYLPKMVLMTYQLPDKLKGLIRPGELDYFELNEFFSATGIGDEACFKYESEVQMWLNFIRGNDITSFLGNLTTRHSVPLPYSSTSLVAAVSHTFWFLPNVAACFAMRNLLKQRQNTFFNDYEIIVAAGPQAGIGDDALKPVFIAMKNPLDSKTITLSCMKLTTGVTVPPWSAVLMLRNISSPETYFQTAFRCQSPWTLQNPNGTNPHEVTNLKPICYVFDFDPNRALQKLADYSCKLGRSDTNPEQQVEEFIEFLPVLAFDGHSMREVNAAGVLDIALSGTSATLLARRWESPALVNVDDLTLSKILGSSEAMAALDNIEAFRGLNVENIQTVLSMSKDLKKKRSDTSKENKKLKKKITKEEKELKSKRAEIRDKLIKFATRIPIFMYLTDFREYTLEDVIRRLEPQLFKKVTGLSLRDFELLLSLNIFNSNLMNDAVYKFKRYEDASLRYTGIERHEFKHIGLWNSVVTDSRD